MYEENLKPLPPGDATVVFANQLREIAQCCRPGTRVTPDSVVQLAAKENQARFAAICRRLLLPGSTISGWENVEEVGRLARNGESCLLCLSHRSNLDVPTLYAMLEDQADVSVFHQIIWIAGRKLSEDSALTQTLARSFNRIVLTPRSWFAAAHSKEELHEAHLINMAAQREIINRRHNGWIFGLFPAGTRLRPGDESTAHAVAETDTYLKTFDHMVLCNIDGCTLPVSNDRDLTHETPRMDRVIFSFGPVLRTSQWRASALGRSTQLDQRLATTRAIDEDIAALSAT